MKKKVYIWGIGKGVKKLQRCLKNKDIDLLGYIDNYAQEKIYQNKPIIKPSEINKNEWDYIIITVTSYNEVLKQCIDVGLERDRIISFYSDKDALNSSFWSVIDGYMWQITLMADEFEQYKIYVQNMKHEIAASIKEHDYKFPKIAPADVAVERIIKEHASLARFGDTEFETIMMRRRSKYQEPNKDLSVRLKEILASDKDNILIGIADNYGSLEKYTDKAAMDIRTYLTETVRKEHMALIDINKQYYDAYVSRPYIIYKDKTMAKVRFDRLREIWNEQDVLVIEGEFSRMGVGNNLFSNARSLKRILAPSKDAYSCYYKIFDASIQFGKEKLILISLGSAATVLAYDLAVAGLWALDIGQIDLEYEWYLGKSNERFNISYKYVNECGGGENVTDIYDKETKLLYESQIVAKIL